MNPFKEKVGTMEAQLQSWGSKLDSLIATVERAGAKTDRDYRAQVEELKAKHQLAQTKLDALKAAGHEKWATFKADIDSAWSEVELAFRKLPESSIDRFGPNAKLRTAHAE